MLNQSQMSEVTVDLEREKQELQIKRQQSIEDSLQLSVKDHMQKLENTLLSLKKDLQDSKKDIGNLRLEVQTLKGQNGINCDDLGKFIYSQVARINGELQKKSQEVQQEVDFYDAQMKTLVMDKKKLDETTSILDNRTQQCESDVGFKHVYD